MNQDDLELIKEFVLESTDLLDEAEPKLIGLQAAGDLSQGVAPELVNTIFRLFHSMKGTAGMLPLGNIAKLTHEAETLLDLFRKGSAIFKPLHTEILLRAMDLIRKMLEQVDRELTDQGHEQNVQDLVNELELIIQTEKKAGKALADKDAKPESENAAGTPRVESPATAGNQKAENATADEELFEVPISPEMMERFVQESDDMLETFEQSMLKLEKEQDAEVLKQAFRMIHSFKGNCSFMGLADLEKLSHRMENILDAMKSGTLQVNLENIHGVLHYMDVLRTTVANISKGTGGEIAGLDAYLESLEYLLQAEGKQPEQQPVAEPSVRQTAVGTDKNIAGSMAAKAVVRQDIRVELHKLDLLINLVGELVISEAMLTRHPAFLTLKNEGLDKAVHQLRRVSEDLQDVAMSVRMVPLSMTFQKMIRLVHDVSRKAGKTVELEIVGEETEVDKTVIEKISDPLVHIIRNAVDHGIETEADRKAAGKPAGGKITMEGRHEGGEVWITIQDDGKGLDHLKILKKARERGLITKDETELTERQIYKLIFEPGFSTAEQVTDISGRGVGLDVVKKNLEKLKGRVDVYSRPGMGTTFVLRIPLTLAIIEGMLVRLGEARYTIPMRLIRESLRPLAGQIITTPDGKELVRVRNDIIPIIRLHEVFEKKSEITDLTKGILIILDVDRQTVSLFVDEILEQQETVIKGLSDYLGSARGISGCTILGNGEISLILDVNELIALAETTPTRKIHETMAVAQV